MSTVREVLSRHRFLLAVAGAYLLIRLYSAYLLFVTSRFQDPVWLPRGSDPYFQLTSTWDGSWYRKIATNGYPEELPRTASGHVKQNPWAFYPLFPYLVRGVMLVLRTDYAETATTLALLLGVGAALVMAKLMDAQIGRVGAWATVLVYASFPAAPVLQMAYTESLAMLLLCLFLYTIIRERWATAGALALVTGLTRPIALPLGLVALVALVLRWRRRAERPMPHEEMARGVLALVACGLSGLIWPTIAWVGTGEPDAYEQTMASWRTTPEVVPFVNWLGNAQYLFGDFVAPFILVALLVTFLAAVLGPWAAGLGPVLRTWCLGYGLYLAAVLDPWTSTFRYSLMFFPLGAVVVGAAWAARAGEAPAQPADGAADADRPAAASSADPAGATRVHAESGLGGVMVRLASSVAAKPEWVVLAKTALIVLWFLALEAVWVWELVRFLPPKDDPP